MEGHKDFGEASLHASLIYIHTYKYIHKYTFTYIHKYTFTYKHTYIHKHIQKYVLLPEMAYTYIHKKIKNVCNLRTYFEAFLISTTILSSYLGCISLINFSASSLITKKGLERPAMAYAAGVTNLKEWWDQGSREVT